MRHRLAEHDAAAAGDGEDRMRCRGDATDAPRVYRDRVRLLIALKVVHGEEVGAY